METSFHKKTGRPWGRPEGVIRQLPSLCLGSVYAGICGITSGKFWKGTNFPLRSK